MTRASCRLLLALALGGVSQTLEAQRDTTRTDSTTVQSGVYNRPFIDLGGSTAIGGYVEGNTNYFVEDGIAEGFSMELRRFNIFLFSSLGSRIRFISELEFEHGTEEIALETALIDFQIDPMLTLRVGVLLPPIGAFNANHDAPRWDFIDRPLVSTRVIPSTLSEVGFGAYGRVVLAPATITYDAYLTNGLQDGVVLNDQGHTSLAAGKSPEQFGADNNGSPAISGRLGVQRRGVGEVGVSYYRAAYNSFRVDGEAVDDARHVRLVALDFSLNVGPASVRGELAASRIDLPAGLEEVLGHAQRGAHLDVVLPVWSPQLLGLREAVVRVALRGEHVDLNVGRFRATGGGIGDDELAIVPGVSFRPTAGTVFKLNYRRHWSRDLQSNPHVGRGGFQVGFASYF